VDLTGVPISAGDLVFVCPRHANRDPAVFPDPDRLDITREKSPHLTFGPGRHHCVGAHLARLEMRVALTALAHRFPELHLAVPRAEVRQREGLQFRELFALPVRW
jgi:cytochrome P450